MDWAKPMNLMKCDCDLCGLHHVKHKMTGEMAEQNVYLYLYYYFRCIFK